jgi:hypothetical protein
MKQQFLYDKRKQEKIRLAKKCRQSNSSPPVDDASMISLASVAALSLVNGIECTAYYFLRAELKPPKTNLFDICKQGKLKLCL